jgi:hypothetical protein
MPLTPPAAFADASVSSASVTASSSSASSTNACLMHMHGTDDNGSFMVRLMPFVRKTPIFVEEHKRERRYVTLHPECVPRNRWTVRPWDMAIYMLDPILVLHLHMHPGQTFASMVCLDRLQNGIERLQQLTACKSTCYTFGRAQLASACLLRPTIDDITVWNAYHIAPRDAAMFHYIYTKLMPAHASEYTLWQDYLCLLQNNGYPFMDKCKAWIEEREATLMTESPMLFEHLMALFVDEPKQKKA